MNSLWILYKYHPATKSNQMVKCYIFIFSFLVFFFISPFSTVNRAVAQYAVDSLKDEGVCRVCSDCVNCEVRPSVRKVSSAPGLMAKVLLISLMCIVAVKLY